MASLLRVENLRTYFFSARAVVKAVENVNFELEQGEVLGLVGESGCGKSTVGLSLMRMVQNPGRIVGGRVLLEGDDLLTKTEEEMRLIRGGKIAMSFQDPMTFLNPVIRVGDQIAEAIRIHSSVSHQEAFERAVAIMKVMEIPAATKRAKDYPHHLSGGMRQRIILGIAIACGPKCLIADEPTTALDVIIQAEIIDLLKNLSHSRRQETAIILITHDLGVITELADRMAVMYAGSIVEIASKEKIFHSPQHPYTAGLLESIPRVDRGKIPLQTIAGNVPDMTRPPTGCKFHPRCSIAEEKCIQLQPLLEEVQPGHFVACFLKGRQGEEDRS